jgi:hypothetical protein
MSADVVNIRDFKRREEREAEIKRFANRLVELGDQIRSMQDTAPSEMPPVQPSYTAHNAAILERLHGVAPNVEISGEIASGDPSAPGPGQTA